MHMCIFDFSAVMGYNTRKARGFTRGNISPPSQRRQQRNKKMQLTVLNTDFEEIYSLLSASFPADELRGKDAFLRLSGNALFRAYTERENGETGRIIGFIGAWELEDLFFIEYFAVDPTLRGRGIGSQMLRELTDRHGRLCLEVEPPETGDMAKRRIGFYLRNGFCLNAYHYIQPAYSAEKKPLRMLMMTSPAAVCAETFREYRALLYKNVYGI